MFCVRRLSQHRPRGRWPLGGQWWEVTPVGMTQPGFGETEDGADTAQGEQGVRPADSAPEEASAPGWGSLGWGSGQGPRAELTHF